MKTSSKTNSEYVLLTRDAPERDSQDEISRFAYDVAGGDGLDCNLSNSLYECSTLVDGYQNKDGDIESHGRKIDKENEQGEIAQGDLPYLRKQLIDMKTLSLIAENLKRGNLGN